MKKARIMFRGIKIINKPVKVEFYTRKGREVKFIKPKHIPKPLKVEFYEKAKR